MERIKQKSKKEKSIKYTDKDKTASFITDIKTIKENLKITEILRTVKMNSSMRIKAPRGSKVMHNNDFNDNDDFIDEATSNDGSETSEPPSATNPDVIINSNTIEGSEPILTNESLNSSNIEEITKDSNTVLDNNSGPNEDRGLLHKSNILSESLTDYVEIDNESISTTPVLPEINIPESPVENSHAKTRDRKLSLDHTMLSRREGFSQSELDLHSIGKSPLERKSSFFRKKMDSFLKNTTEIFKRQSFQSKSQCLKRRESMSVSLQSLNEKSPCNGDENGIEYQEGLQGSLRSLQSSLTAGRSASSLSVSQSDRLPPDIQSEDDSLVGSQPFVVVPSSSVHSLNEAYVQEALLNRAISMNSGLDSAHVQGRRKASRSNRVTWVASEGLTNYFRRVIQDEKTRDMQGCHSYQDFSTIPEDNLYGTKTDSKGRRLSYQRAVSGEDPVTSTRYQDASLRRKQLIPENSEANYEIANKLAEFTRNGVPTLQGFNIAEIRDEAFACLIWVEKWQNPNEIYGGIRALSPYEEARQAVIRELLCTEVDYIRHLIAIVEVFIAAAHALQDDGKLLVLDTQQLFNNIPDILNANLNFWDITFYPMIVNSIENKIPFNSDYMAGGFYRFRELLYPYEKYVDEQPKAISYLRQLSNDADFMIYSSWCHSHKSSNRLQFSDILVKPMQRLTKYSLLIRRLIDSTDTEPERTNLIAMEHHAKNYLLDINRSIRLRNELEKIDELMNTIECYEIEFKDEELDRAFRMYSKLNLKAPMVNCNPNHSRQLIYQGDLRFKDNLKEMEVKVFLLTDMILICKKLNKGGQYLYKLIRPKYMLNKITLVPRSRGGDNSTLICVVFDDVGTAYTAFAISDLAKESQDGMKTWELKFREAKLTYELSIWYSRHPIRDISELDMDTSSEYSANPAKSPPNKQVSDELSLEREARERVAIMLHRSVGVSAEYDQSLGSIPTESFDEQCPSVRQRDKQDRRHVVHRASTGESSRTSRLSSFQQSLSATSHDEPQAGPSSKLIPEVSIEHITTEKTDDGAASITVNVVSESESDTVVSAQQPISLPVPPVVVLQHSPPHKAPIRSSSASRNTLRIQPENEAYNLVHSLPDLTIEPLPKLTKSHPSKSASEQLYRSHQELLQRKRLAAAQQHQYLSPDHRGTSYPPPSPTRASLKRGLAFSHSIKNPPLSKMGHVHSQSQVLTDPGPSTSQMFKIEKSSSTTIDSKGDKKSKNVASRTKNVVTTPPTKRTTKEPKGGGRRDRSESRE